MNYKNLRTLTIILNIFGVVIVAVIVVYTLPELIWYVSPEAISVFFGIYYSIFLTVIVFIAYPILFLKIAKKHLTVDKL